MALETRELRALGYRVSLLTGDHSAAELDYLDAHYDDVIIDDAFFGPARSPQVRRKSTKRVSALLGKMPPIDLAHLHLLNAGWSLDWLTRRMPTVVYAHVAQCPNGSRRRHHLDAPCDRNVGLTCLTQGFRHDGCGDPPDDGTWSTVNMLSAMQKDAAARAAQRRCSMVLAPSRWQLDRLRRDAALPERAEVLPPPVELLAGARVPRARRSVLLYAGRLARVKRPEEAVRLLARLGPDTELHLAGDGPARDEIAALGDALGVGDRMRFLGRLSTPELADEIAAADVLVAPYTMPETFNLAGAEAAEAGLPVVGYDVGGMREWADRYDHVRLVQVGDLNALVAAAQAMLEAGRPEKVSTVVEFTPQAHVAALVGIYERVLGASDAPVAPAPARTAPSGR